MGVWSHKPFENDEAEEFLALLQSDDGASHLKSTLKELNLRELDDEDECSRAVAACEVVAAAAGYAVPGLPNEIRAFLKTGSFTLTPALHKRSQQVAAAILKSSGLAELWAESGKAKGWQRCMQSLIERLDRPIKGAVTNRRTAAGKAKSTAPSSRAAASEKTSTERRAGKPSIAGEHDKSISLREAKSILAKLGDGYVGPTQKDKKLHEVSFGTLRRYPGIKDAERLATLQNVDAFTVGGEKLSAEKLGILQTLIRGWKPLRKLTATGTTGGFAAWLCSHAPSMDFLEKLELDYTDVTDADLKALQRCVKLRELDLSRTSVTVKGLTSLTQVQSLQRISICNCDQISIAAAAKFVVQHADRFDIGFLKSDEALGIQSLTTKEKSGFLKQNARVIACFDKAKNAWPNHFFGTTFVVGAVPPPVPLQDIAKECWLERLVIGNEYTDEAEGLTKDDFRLLLTAWPDLRELRIGRIPDSDSVLSETLSGLKQLQKLELIETPCGDAIFPAISKLKNLVRIDLHGTRITGAGLSQLAKLPRLRWVGLENNPNLTSTDADVFRECVAGRVWVDFGD